MKNQIQNLILILALVRKLISNVSTEYTEVI
jgi:hypothetical protein